MSNEQTAKAWVEIETAKLEEILEELQELRGERDWWKDEPRCNHQRDYNNLCGLIEYVRKTLNP